MNMDASSKAGDELNINENRTSFLSDLFEKRLGVDFIIEIGDKVIHGHRIILSAAIPYFTALFSSGLREEESGKVVLKDIHPDATEMIIGYVYTGKLKINRNNWQALLIAADFLQLQQIINYCCDYLEKNLNLEGLFQTKHLSILANFPNLVKKIDGFVIENFEAISKRSEFLDLSLDELLNIISRDGLKIQNELNTFLFLINWIKHDLEARKPNLAQLFKEIRLHLISKENLIKFISREPLITEDKECYDYLFKALSYHILAEERSNLRELWTRKREYSKTPHFLEKEMIYILRGDYQTPQRPLVEKLKLDPFSTERQEIPDGITFNATALLDGKLYMIGDSDEYEPSTRVYVLDLHTGEFSGAAPMHYPRKGFGVAVYEDKIYVFGGADERGVGLKSVECFIPARNKWIMKSDMSASRCRLTAIVLDGSIYAVGGSYIKQSVERYDPARGTWTTIAPMFIEYDHSAAAVLDGKIFVSGGKSARFGSSRATIVYDPNRGTWVAGPSMINARHDHHLVNYQSKLYAIGGRGHSSGHLYDVNIIEELKPEADQKSWRWIETKHRFALPLGGSIQVVKLMCQIPSIFSSSSID